MTRNQKLFAYVAGGIAFVIQLLSAQLWSFAGPVWGLQMFIALAEWGLILLCVWFFSKLPMKNYLTMTAIAGVVAAFGFLIAIASFFAQLGVGVIGQAMANLGLASLAGIGKNAASKLRLSSANAVYAGGIVLGYVLQALVVNLVPFGDWLQLPFSAVSNCLILTGAAGLLSTLRNKMLARSATKLSLVSYPLELRVKKFFAAKALASGTIYAIAAGSFFLTALASQALGFWLVLGYGDGGQYLLLLLAAAALVYLFSIWIPALIANRALAKGKSWDAFFWLSIFVSPLLMWIIAEASTDTRGMVYVPAQQAPVDYAPAPVPAAPVAASDTRECPECAETIKKAAKLCKHCGSKVTPIA